MEVGPEGNLPFHLPNGLRQKKPFPGKLRMGPQERVRHFLVLPGGKSFAAAIAMGDRGEIISCDLHENKLKRIRPPGPAGPAAALPAISGGCNG